MNFDAFIIEVTRQWKQVSLARQKETELQIGNLQEQSHFYFGNADVGAICIAPALEKHLYKFNFKDMGRTPFSLSGVHLYEDWLHIALIHVQTAFVNGLPAQPSISDLENMRQFAALTYSIAQTNHNLFPCAEISGFTLSPNYKPIIVSLGYITVQRSLNNSKAKTTITRGFLLDYLHPYTFSDSVLTTLDQFHGELAAFRA